MRSETTGTSWRCDGRRAVQEDDDDGELGLMEGRRWLNNPNDKAIRLGSVRCIK